MIRNQTGNIFKLNTASGILSTTTTTTKSKTMNLNSIFFNRNSAGLLAVLSICLVLLPTAVSSISILRNRSVSSKLEPLLWTSSNDQFRPGKGQKHLQLSAQIGDNIDLVCPKFDPVQDNAPEYLTIYKVGSKYEFDNCIINPNNRHTVPILKCDKPNAAVKFTLFFIKFSPVPFALEFEEGQEYYFLTTSSGNLKGLDYLTGGLCNKFNMKFSIKIDLAKEGESSQIIQKMITSTTSTISQKLQQSKSRDGNPNETPLPSKMLMTANSGVLLSSFSIYLYILAGAFVTVLSTRI